GQSPWKDDYDLISGLVGFGVYALERMTPGADATRLAAVVCLERVINRLAETAEHRAEGITWWTNPAWLPPETRPRWPPGYYNVGLAHGVPGVIALLGCVCAAPSPRVLSPTMGERTRGEGVALPQARALLNGAVRWLLEQDGPDGFRYWIGPGTTEGKAR